jgi:hypothetical protein
VRPPELISNWGFPSLIETVNGKRFETITKRILEPVVADYSRESLRSHSTKVTTRPAEVGSTGTGGAEPLLDGPVMCLWPDWMASVGNVLRLR